MMHTTDWRGQLSFIRIHHHRHYSIYKDKKNTRTKTLKYDLSSSFCIPTLIVPHFAIFRHPISEMNRVRGRPWLHRIIDNYSAVSHQIICMHYRKAAFIYWWSHFSPPYNWKKTNNNQRLLLHARIYNGFPAFG